jgi:hypothetical protein
MGFKKLRLRAVFSIIFAMPMTCVVRRAAFAAFLLSSIAWTQSLEDKVSQARRLQAQSLLGVDQATLDSVVQAKKRAGQGADRLSERDLEEAVLDSLIAGPQTLDSAAEAADSLFFADDTSALPGMKRMRKKRQPRRYEQRIFQSVDRSAFTSATGGVGREYILGPGSRRRPWRLPTT